MLFKIRVVLTHHIPDAQDNGACPNMTTQAAAGRVPSVPRRNHHLSVQKLHDQCMCLYLILQICFYIIRCFFLFYCYSSPSQLNPVLFPFPVPSCLFPTAALIQLISAPRDQRGIWCDVRGPLVQFAVPDQVT